MESPHTFRPWAYSARAPFPLLTLGVCLLTLLLFFRDTVVSGFDLITGNVGDNRFCIVVLEHWLHVLHGQARLTSPIFFWPEPGVLGYSECLVLFLPPYAAARTIGFDRYLAFQSALIITKAIGFGGMYLLLRYPFAVDAWVALLGAVLFTLSNSYYLAAGHAQLTAVAFVPVVFLVAWVYRYNRMRARRVAALLSLGTCALLVALLLLTSFYIGWFTVFIGGLLCIVSVILAAARPHTSNELSGWAFSEVARVASDVGLALTIFLLSLIPFLRIYRPVLNHLGGRAFGEVVAYTPEPWHALDIGPGNVVWGSMLSGVTEKTNSESVFAPYEFQRGWPPLVVVVFLTTLVISLRRTWSGSRQTSEARGRDFLVVAVGATAVLAWLLSVRLGRATAWQLVFLMIPGASAIRVPVRINLLVNPMVLVVAMIGLTQWKTASRTRGRRLANAALALVALMLTSEQVNGTQIAQISRARERAAFARIGPPPPGCKQFYAIKPPTADILDTAEGQIDAMLVAYDWRIPTLNGWSGNVPPGWNLYAFDGDSPQRAIAWATAKGVAKNLCELDLATGTWSRADASPP